jgi:hypothetical protein
VFPALFGPKHRLPGGKCQLRDRPARLCHSCAAARAAPADRWGDRAMTRTGKLLCVFYALVALLALYGTWSQNLAYFGPGAAKGASFLGDLAVNPAAKSITIDIGFFLLAAAMLMVTEARRIGMRLVWLYVVFGFVIAISVTFPLFLIAREMRLASAAPVKTPSTLIVVLDGIGLVALTGLALYQLVALH